MKPSALSDKPDEDKARTKIGGVIIGYSLNDSGTIRFIHVAREVGGKLQYAGGVLPTGDPALLFELRENLMAIPAPQPIISLPFDSNWVLPTYTCQISYGMEQENKKLTDLRWEGDVQKLKLGTVDMAVPSTVMSSEIDLYGIFELPYMVRDREHMKRIEKEVFWPAIEPATEKRGLKVLALWENGYRHITNNKRPVRVPARNHCSRPTAATASSFAALNVADAPSSAASRSRSSSRSRFMRPRPPRPLRGSRKG